MAGFLPMWSPINSNIGDGSNLWDTAIKSQARASDMLNAAVDTIRTNQQNSANAALLQAYQKALANGATPDEARASAAAAANPFVTADTLSNMFQNSRNDVYSNIQKAQEDRTAKDWQGQNEAARQSNLVNTMYLKRDKQGYNQALDNANSVLSDIALKYFKAPDLTTTLLNDEQTKAQADNARAGAENSRAQAARSRAQAALDMSNLYEQKILDAYYAEKAALGLDREPDENLKAGKINNLNKKYEQLYPGFMQIASKFGKQDILANTATAAYNTKVANNIINDPVIRQKLENENADLIKKQDKALEADMPYDERADYYAAQGMSVADANLRATKETLIGLAQQEGDAALQERIKEAKTAKDLQKLWASAMAIKSAPAVLYHPSVLYNTKPENQPSLFKKNNPELYKGININDDGSLNINKSINTSIDKLNQEQKQKQANIKEAFKTLRLGNDVSLAVLNKDEKALNAYASKYDTLISTTQNQADRILKDANMGVFNSRMLTNILNSSGKLNNVESLLEIMKGDNIDPYTNFKGDKQQTIKYAKKARTKLLNSRNDKGQPFSEEAIDAAIYAALSDPNNKPIGDNWINNIDQTQLETYANKAEQAYTALGPQLKQIDALKRSGEVFRNAQKGQKALRQKDKESWDLYIQNAVLSAPR